MLHAFQLRMCETQRNIRQSTMAACQTPFCKALGTKRNSASISKFRSLTGRNVTFSVSVSVGHVGDAFRRCRILSDCSSARFLSCLDPSQGESTDPSVLSTSCTFYVLPLNSAFISVAWHCLWVENNILCTHSTDSLRGVGLHTFLLIISSVMY